MVRLSKIILNATNYVVNDQTDGLSGLLKKNLRHSFMEHSGVWTGHNSIIRHGSLFVASMYDLFTSGENWL